MTTPEPPAGVRPRLRLAEDPGQGSLDGGWWPRSRDLLVELAELVEQLPPELGRVVRVAFSPPDWDTAPDRIPVPEGYVEAVALPDEDTHLVDLRMADQQELRLLVVPPELTDGQGAEAMLAAATSGYTHTAAELLETVSEHPDVDPRDQWLG